MSRVVIVDREYLNRLESNFEDVRNALSRNQYPPVQGKIGEYIRKGEEMLNRARSLLGSEMEFPDYVYHRTNSSNTGGINVNGIWISGDERTTSMWEGRERSIVPGVYVSSCPDLKDWVPQYDTLVTISTKLIDPCQFIWDEEAVGNTPLQALTAPGKAVFLGEIPREWILDIDKRAYSLSA